MQRKSSLLCRAPTGAVLAYFGYTRSSSGVIPAMAQTLPGPGGRLDSWKEVAAYLGRGTRTVQRWEREEGLPVHRLMHDKLGSVYAFKTELDTWMQGRRAEDLAQAGGPPSIAVLSFADLSREKDQGYFCDGIAEEITGALSRIGGLKVASRTSALRLQAGAADAREAGRKLGVRTLLEGSVRKAGDRLRIIVELVNAADGYQIWAGQYDRDLRDIFAVQEEIARSVVQQLEVTLSAQEHDRLGRKSTADVEAYDYFLRGRSYYYAYTVREVECAVQLFERAIARDPDYALAFAGLADCWSYLYLYSDQSQAHREQADRASARAVDLDPHLAAAHAARAVAHSLGGRNAEAERSFERAIALDPELFEAYYFRARHCFARGRSEEAAHWYEAAMRARSDDYQAPLLAAQVFEDLGRPADAAAARRLGIERARRQLDLCPDATRALYMAANGLAALGEHAEARLMTERALALKPDDPMVLYNAGCVYAMLGHREEALRCLENAVDQGLRQTGWYLHDNNLDPLRADPRFAALLLRLP